MNNVCHPTLAPTSIAIAPGSEPPDLRADLGFIRTEKMNAPADQRASIDGKNVPVGLPARLNPAVCETYRRREDARPLPAGRLPDQLADPDESNVKHGGRLAAPRRALIASEPRRPIWLSGTRDRARRTSLSTQPAHGTSCARRRGWSAGSHLPGLSRALKMATHGLRRSQPDASSRCRSRRRECTARASQPIPTRQRTAEIHGPNAPRADSRSPSGISPGRRPRRAHVRKRWREPAPLVKPILGPLRGLHLDPGATATRRGREILRRR